ncbi:DUF86 domain-containing protein [Agromyces sp. CFH 90414]|uniref:DUF86 domain-containing protein n=1 Tax=Agromyces agglutinans TaxID=2662258 RepID=A0A6I2FHW6_9MICO|nr:HepT-like ribonuclease domain-containing protein [Agromyces agglutinans]MRG60398.1 DUF86 domain-containing protein [Agromyces agglutinans]
MSEHEDRPPARFVARPRTQEPEGPAASTRERRLAEVERLRSRFERAARDDVDAFRAPGSDAYDIGMLAVIHLADFVGRDLPSEVIAVLPQRDRDGLRATRNIAAHNYAGLDNTRLWETVTVHGPALLDLIEAELTRE